MKTSAWLGVTAAVCSAIFGIGCSGTSAISDTPFQDDAADENDSADSLSETATFFTYSRTERFRCMGCDKDYVKRVNFSTTKCADGPKSVDCYAKNVDLSALKLSAGDEQKLGTEFHNGHVLIRGVLKLKPVGTSDNLPVLVASEAWMGNALKTPTGLFYRMTTNQVNCLPEARNSCATVLHEARLNSTSDRDNVFNIDLARSGATQKQVDEATTTLHDEADGILVAGSHQPLNGGLKLTASEFYTRVQASQTGNGCPVESATVKYAFTDLMKCAAVMYSCGEGFVRFSNACGCGCALLD